MKNLWMDFVQTRMGMGVDLFFEIPAHCGRWKSSALSPPFIRISKDCDGNRHTHVCKYKSISKKLIYHVRTNFSSSNYLSLLP
jgi:hypothetical protein